MRGQTAWTNVASWREEGDVRPSWALDTFSGRLTEISGGATGAPLTFAFRLALEAQRRAEPVAWIGRRCRPFFPPDAAEAGLDLTALPVVWTVDSLAAARATDLLLRSGAFGLVLVDLGLDSRLPLAAQTRLASLARQHAAAVICLTEKSAERPSLGSLVSLHAHAIRTGRDAERFRCEARVLKDKRRGPSWRHVEVCDGPDGLR